MAKLHENQYNDAMRVGHRFRLFVVVVLTACAPASWADQPACSSQGSSVSEGAVDTTVKCVDQVLQTQTETPLKNLALEVYPTCKDGRPVGPQSVTPTLQMQFERNFPRPGTGQTEYVGLHGRKLSLVGGIVYLSSVAHAGKSLTWRKIGTVDNAAINCAWTHSPVKMKLLSGGSLTLHERREMECRQQREDDSLIPLIDDDYTKTTHFRLEIAPGDDGRPISLSSEGSTWYSTHLNCMHARGERVTKVR